MAIRPRLRGRSTSRSGPWSTRSRATGSRRSSTASHREPRLGGDAGGRIDATTGAAKGDPSRARLQAGWVMRHANGFPRGQGRTLSLQRVDELEQEVLLQRTERCEPVARGPALTVVREDGLADRVRAAVMEELRVEPRAPQRRRTHQPRGRERIAGVADAIA